MGAVSQQSEQSAGLRFELEISRAYLSSTVREMVHSTARSAYSTCFAEGLDFTCGIFSADGKLAVQVAGIPAHAGTLVDAMEAILRAYDVFAPGDVIIHNDPFDGGSHQADVLVARPLFHEGELYAFAANKGHWVDVGGASAGGWDGSLTHAVQEGLVIPPVKLYEGGHLRREVRDFILGNVRVRKYVWGDLQAQIAATIVAEKRLAELARRKGLEHVVGALAAAISYAEQHFLSHLLGVPIGIGTAEDVMEDDGRGGGPYAIKVRVEVNAKGVLIDFDGTDPQAAAPINCVLACAKSAAYVAAISVLDPSLPYLSSGSLDLIEVRVPEACLLNAKWPAPIFGGTADPADRAAETVMKALANLMPDRVTAGSYATGNNTVGFGRDGHGEEFLWYFFESGGCGARQHADGNSGEWHLLANSPNESMELWEARFPGKFEGYSLVPDSGGAGRRRGGLGTERRFVLFRDATVSALADRHRVAPWGLEGGSEGTCNAFEVIREGRVYRPGELGVQSDSKFGGLNLRAGDVYVVRQGGGGGFGPPRERPYAEINRDLRCGYVTPKGAEMGYEVVISYSGSLPVVDGEATDALRRASTLERSWKGGLTE